MFSSSSSSSSSLTPISPSKLRSDLYSFSCQYEPPKTPLVISVLASLIERAIARNDWLVKKHGNVAPLKDARSRSFDSYQVLDMSIQSFLERIFRYARVAPPVYIVAYVYMDRLRQLNPGLRISSINVHRLLITTIMVASKFVEDMRMFSSYKFLGFYAWWVFDILTYVSLTSSRNYRNSYFAQVGGLTTSEINKLELDFMFLMWLKLYVSVSVFESYCKHLEREVSYGGGYQLERSLRFKCDGEITSKEMGRRAQLAQVL